MQENKEEPMKKDAENGKGESGGEEQMPDAGQRITESYKRIRNSQESQSNITIIQCLNYLEKNDGLVIGDTDNIQNIDFSKAAANETGKKQSVPAEGIFRDKNTLMEWCIEQYHKYSLAFLTAGAVFERMPYSWVCDCAKELYQVIREEEDEQAIIPKSRLLEQCSMETYLGSIVNETGNMPVEFVRMKSQENCDEILECICTEFSEMRDAVVKWLYKYVFSENWNKSSRAIRAISKMARYDFEYFKNRVLPHLQKEKKLQADYAIARMMAEISEDARYADNVRNSMRHWGTVEDNIHLKLTALLGYTKMRMPEEEIKPVFSYYFRSLISRLETGDDTFLEQLPMMYLLGNRYGAYYRAMVSALYDISCQKMQGDKAELLYFELVAEDYMNFGRSRGKEDMIFIKLCRYLDDTAEKCRYLWKRIWRNPVSKKIVKKILCDYFGKLETDSLEKIEGILCLVLGKDKMPDIKRLEQDICRKKNTEGRRKDGRI